MHVNYNTRVCRYGTINCQVDPPIVEQELEIVKQRFLTLSAIMSLEDFVRGWWMGATLDQLKRGNAESFVAYSMYCRRKDDLSIEASPLTQASRSYAFLT
jgi:hypothetical protein